MSVTSIIELARTKNKYEGKLLRKVRFDNNNSVPFIRLFSHDGDTKFFDDELDRVDTGEVVLCLFLSDKRGYWQMECVTPRGRRGFVAFSTFMWEVAGE
jgi:hypothetical protein